LHQFEGPKAIASALEGRMGKVGAGRGGAGGDCLFGGPARGLTAGTPSVGGTVGKKKNEHRAGAFACWGGPILPSGEG